MARPKRQPGEPDVRQRIGDACWELLATRRISQITVGDVAERAHCNRGTFYYHYDDMNALVNTMIEHELTAECSLPAVMFYLTAGSGLPANDQELAARTGRVRLVMERGGMNLVFAKSLEVALGMWSAVLCPDGSPLEEKTRIAIEYAVGGTLGLLSLGHGPGSSANELEDRNAALEILADYAQHLIAKISAVQHIPEEALRSRLAIVASLARGTRT